jgi:hypothetical protein
LRTDEPRTRWHLVGFACVPLSLPNQRLSGSFFLPRCCGFLPVAAIEPPNVDERAISFRDPNLLDLHCCNEPWRFLSKAVVKHLRERFRLGEITVVTDRGMGRSNDLGSLCVEEAPRVDSIVGVRMQQQKEVNASVLGSRACWFESSKAQQCEGSSPGKRRRFASSPAARASLYCVLCATTVIAFGSDRMQKQRRVSL